MAVVLGIEISHLFNCSVKQPGGLAEIDGCDKDEIDTQLDRLHDLGVRQMFPVHEFDNGFGGNGIFDGFVLNVGNFVDTGKFWDTYDCPQDDYFFGPGAHMKTSIRSEEHTSELQSLMILSYAVYCLKKKKV